MKVVYFQDENARTVFAYKAAKHFNDHPAHWSYAEGDPAAGEFLALRWGTSGQAVLVMKLDESFEPICFADCIETEPYPRKPE